MTTIPFHERVPRRKFTKSVREKPNQVTGEKNLQEVAHPSNKSRLYTTSTTNQLKNKAELRSHHQVPRRNFAKFVRVKPNQVTGEKNLQEVARPSNISHLYTTTTTIKLKNKAELRSHHGNNPVPRSCSEKENPNQVTGAHTIRRLAQHLKRRRSYDVVRILVYAFLFLYHVCVIGRSSLSPFAIISFVLKRSSLSLSFKMATKGEHLLVSHCSLLTRCKPSINHLGVLLCGVL